MNRLNKAALVTLLLIATASVTYAAKNGLEDDATSIANAKISLIQATTAAEQHAKGKAIRAEYERSRLGWVFDVEVVSGPKVFDVRVDPDSGVVLSSAEDAHDRDDGHDKRD